MTNNEFDETVPVAPETQEPEASPNLNESTDETLPTQTSVDGENGTTPPDDEQAPDEQGRPRWKLITLAGILALLVIAVLSAWRGYTSGINLRTDAEATQVGYEAANQYALGVQDMQEGKYDRARQRFEYVIELNPNYPEVTDKLAEVLLMLNATATPSPVPTATITPTPDTSEADAIGALFSQSEQQLANEDWSGAIETLLQIRKKDPSYRVIDIDGMLFIALRNQGLYKISYNADLEGGMYDLGLAERFGPLDSEAQGILTWVELYITGASFWELDWGQAVFYFSQVAPQLPSLRDGSGWTAKERYRLALIGFGDTLLLAGDPCQAMDQYQLSLSLGYDAEAELSLAEAIKQCEGGKPQQKDQSSGPPQGEPPGGLPEPTQIPNPYPNP